MCRPLEDRFAGLPDVSLVPLSRRPGAISSVNHAIMPHTDYPVAVSTEYVLNCVCVRPSLVLQHTIVPDRCMRRDCCGVISSS